MSVTFQLDEQQHHVVFDYDYEVVPANPKKENSQAHEKPVSTSCVIMLGDSVLGQGNSTCNPKDSFRYTRGRKHAIRRAMNAAGFDRPTRTQIWEQIIDYIRG